MNLPAPPDHEVSAEHQETIDLIMANIEARRLDPDRLVALVEDSMNILFYTPSTGSYTPKTATYRVVMQRIAAAAEFEDERRYLHALVLRAVAAKLTGGVIEKYTARVSCCG